MIMLLYRIATNKNGTKCKKREVDKKSKRKLLKNTEKEFS